ncbi:MAG: hypothetical protein JEZ14_08225 [Marinilabiliaceae bacterium]|nr:hypothetical protein [Marinilabiliaceae bacterium]
MEVYIDKNFVLNYWAVSKNEAPFLNFENEFLKHPNLYTIITNFESLEEILESEEASLFFNDIIQETKVADIVYLPQLNDKECLESCLQNGGFKMFLMEYDNTSTQYFEDQYGFQFLSTQQIQDKWSKFEGLKSIEKTIALPTDCSDNDIFNSWKDLNFISQFPNNSIVISDKSHSQLKQNLLPLIEELIPNSYQGILYISILSEELLSQKKALSMNQRAVEVHQLLNRTFARYKDMKIKFSVIGFDKYFNSGDQPTIHDRHIYTNYFTIKSGIGFNLFNNGNRKVEDSEVVIAFNFQRFNMKTIPAKINGLKSYLKKMRKSDKLDVFKYYPVNFENSLLN